MSCSTRRDPRRNGELAAELEQGVGALGLAPLRLVERAFSSATAAWPASTSSRRRSSSSNWSRPSFEMTIAPITREP